MYQRLLQRLRDARAESGLTQAEAARALGKPQSCFYKCESWERRLDPVELGLFAQIYKKPITYFYS